MFNFGPIPLTPFLRGKPGSPLRFGEGQPPHDKVPSEYWRALFLVEVKALRFVLDLRQRWQWHIDKGFAFFA